MILDVPTPHDHCHILILVKLHGYRNSDRCSLVLNRIYDRIKRVNVVTVSDNPQRTVSVKYVNYYSPKWNQWGEFQAHRRLLGLLYVATLDSNTSLTVTPTSRKASFDPVSDPNSPEDVGLLDVSKSRSRSCVTQLNFEQSNGSGSGFDSQLNSSTSNDCLTGANSQHAVIEQFRTSIDEFKATLYDSRCFIFGSETFVASDSNCHNGITENTTLHNGDRPTCLNVNDNRVKEKNVLYYSSLEDCKTDFESQVKEFVNNLYWILESKRLDRSFEKQTDSLHCPLAPGEEKCRVGLDSRNTKAYRKKAIGRHCKLLADYSLMAGLPSLAVDAYGSSIEMLKATNDWLWLAGAYEGLACAATVMRYSQHRSQEFHRVATFTPGQMKLAVSKANQIAGDLVTPRSPSHTPERFAKNTMADSRSFLKEVLSPLEILDRFRLAIDNYQKFSFAAFVELDCALKASKVLIFEHQYLEVAECLRINTERYLRPAYTLFDSTSKAYVCQVLATVFKEIGFKRKSAFYLRLTAMYKLKLDQDGVAHTQKDFRAVYPLLLSAMDGFGCPGNPKDFPLDHPFGWSDVQTRAMHEIYLAARRGLNYQLAERHLRYILTYLSQYLPDQLLFTFCQDLTELSRYSSSSSHIQGPGSLLIPPVPLIRTPIVLHVSLQPLPAYLAPSVIRSPTSADSSSVFIYTPLYSLRRKSTESIWVAHCSSSVSVVLSNPLNGELHVDNLMLLCEGVQYESVPVSVLLPPLEKCLAVKLPLIPKTSGTLTITGYVCEVFGNNSTCRFKDCYELHLPRPVPGKESFSQENNFSVKVCTAMPVLNLACDLGNESSHRLVDHTLLCSSVSVSQGETKHSLLRVQNNSACQADYLVVRVVNQIRDEFEVLFQLNTDEISAQLPLLPGGLISIPIQIFGIFTSFNGANMVDPTDSAQKKNFEVQVRLEYGCVDENGDGDQSLKYQRVCSAVFNITVFPVLLLKQIAVLPSCGSDSRYVMIHAENVSTNDLEIHVGADKRFHVGQGDSHRFPVPFDGMKVGRESLTIIACQNYLRNTIDVKWFNPTKGESGIVALWPTIQSLDDCRKILIPPMTCSLTFNGVIHKDTSDHLFSVGDVVQVSVNVHFSEGTDRWHHIVLSALWFQDLQNGRRKSDLKEQLVQLGPKSFEILSTDFPEKLVVFQVIFVCSGNYKIEIAAVMSNGEKLTLTPAIPVNIMS